MKKVLFTATVDSHILAFHIPYLRYFKEKGYEVHVATNGDEEIPYCDKKYKISFERSPYKLNNIRAIKQLKKVIDKEKYDLIHTHTPMGSVVTRLAARSSRKKNNTRVIYTAHGFHFYKGAPLKNWLMFYPVEKFLAKYTDDLVTINKEDYEIAKSKFKTNVHYIPGVGIDPNKFDIKMSDKEKEELRKSLGLKKDDFVMIYIAELNMNKNQTFLINVMDELVKKYKNIHLILPGKDSYNGKYHEMVKDKKLDSNIHFLGFRKDIPKLLKISNLSVSSSLREGLPVNIIEGMYCGLPVVAVDCRGMSDLIKDKLNGFLFKFNQEKDFETMIEKIYQKKIDLNGIINNNINDSKKYTLNSVMQRYIDVYKSKIIYLRSTSIINDSRAIKEIESYKKRDYNVLALGWDRQKIVDRVENNMIMFNVSSTYGSGLKNLGTFLKYQLWLYKNLKKYKNLYNVIHACDFDTAFVASKIAKKYNKKLIYDIYDYYADCHNLSFLRNIVEKSDIKVINKANSVIICTEQRRKQISKANPRKVSVIHNTPNIKSGNNDIVFDEKKVKICYVGILQDDRLLIEITEQIRENSKYELYVGGFGKYDEYFKKMSQENNNIHFYGQMKYEDVLNLERKCDILFATYNPKVQNHKFSAPNKVYEAMALGKPIIVCKGTGIDELVIKEKIGYSINYDAKEFVNVLNKVTLSEYKAMSEKTQMLYREKYMWEKMEDELINNLEGM